MADTDIQELIDGAREKVRGYLQLIDPDFEEYDSGMFTVEEGSAVIGITIRPWHEGDVVVEFTSQLVNGVELDDQTKGWLLETNADLHFGSFGLLFDNTVIYSYTVPASTLDQATFAAVTQTVAKIADHYDDAILEATGGTKGASLEPVD